MSEEKESIFSIMDRSIKSNTRNYGDVKISAFECGCRIITIVDEPYLAFSEICEVHRRERTENLLR